MENTSSKSKILLTKAQAAQFIGVSERTLSRYHSEGMGPPRIKPGGKVGYLEATLMDWLKSFERGPVR